ncbi:type II restriction endonuclease subunit M [Mycobacterium marseillense]|uniref:Eco57I restriction-modification methylase domain-containing protein n=1 Tax=Mycobacterium marseillense TaxID=701042 RepID=UPI0007FBCDAD|nr:DNA methyltransferase [Mycobacterium marseillense]MCA2266295.1 SAM-dependent DNA methyltransferase [Mycobacterium marseillense]OBJ69896.1 type II restriction endonuclease subunit M [Mycobacterium marseillense]
MAVRRKHQSTTNAADLHRQWLELVDTEGPFLAIPPLKRVWPQGMPRLPEDRKEALIYARKDFEPTWEALDRAPDDPATLDAYRIARDKWVETVLREVVGWAESLSWGEVPGVSAQSPNRAVMVTAHGALTGPDGIGALVYVIDPADSLRQVPNDLWAAAPADRMEALLRDNGIEIGIVTDGRWWGLVCAREGSMAASGIVDALTWIEEPRTRDAFLALLGRQYIVGGVPNERLPVLFAESIAAAEEITEALGAQVRRAVELLIASFSESAADAQNWSSLNPLPSDPHQSYEAALTVMMRIVFLLFAEERGLMPSGELFEQGYGIAGSLDRLQGRETADGEETLDATSMMWHRLLATSQALYAGASFEGMRMPAYGGSLFDPARFPFLTATTEHGTLALTVSDRVMLHVLRSVQQAVLKGGEARRISFRDIDVEQIGYIYEGLLGYTAVTVDQPYLGLQGKKGEEPEIPLAVLEGLAAEHATPKEVAEAIRAWVEHDQPAATPQSAPAITKALGAKAEPNMVSALTQAAGGDAELRERALKWLSLIREDLRGRPFIVRAGGLIVKETLSRKNAGAHYTPKSLAEEVVLHALQPLCYSPGPYQTADEAAWKLKSSDDILSLKVGDIACGSGAFLVAAVRYLAERVVEAWTAEDSANSQRRDLYLRAIREVVANCIYGADINDMAVEMCKLSLWLVSLDRDLPFSFVDDKIFLGNSLLGLTSLDQLRKLHIDPSRVPATSMIDIFDVDIDAIIHRAAELRRKLATEIVENDPARNSNAKRRQLTQLRDLTGELRKIADGVIAAGLALGGKPGKALDEAYENLRVAVKAAHPESGQPDSTMLDSTMDTGLAPTVPTDYRRWRPNHWVLEAPDVVVERGGFDAIIGNPPFLGGKKISGAVGSDLREWLVNVIAGGATGNADQVAYFFLRAQSLLASNGTLGLIATNTIAQGDTRQVGLDRMADAGFVITRSIQSRSWPVASASLEFAAVWGTVGPVAEDVARFSDEASVKRISTLLEPEGAVEGKPLSLNENAGTAFQGCVVVGLGFVLEPGEAQGWISEDRRNAEVVFPYLNGEDLNQRPDCSASRWVIDFNDASLDTASQFPVPFRRVKNLVYPERQKVNRKAHRERWWQYGDKRPALRKAIAEFEEVLVIGLVSKAVMPARVPTGQVFSHKLAVFATDSYADQAVLSSSLHQMWAIKYGSTLETRVNYSPSDVFETYPRPEVTARLKRIGRTLDSQRREIMLRRKLGLTDLYNLVNEPQITDAVDPDVARMRTIHVELDEAVMDAYGWADVPLNHGFHTYRQMQRWTVSPAARVEILDRLLEENHRRAATEAKTRVKPKGKAGRGRNVSEGQGTLIP